MNDFFERYVVSGDIISTVAQEPHGFTTEMQKAPFIEAIVPKRVGLVKQSRGTW